MSIELEQNKSSTRILVAMLCMILLITSNVSLIHAAKPASAADESMKTGEQIYEASSRAENNMDKQINSRDIHGRQEPEKQQKIGDDYVTNTTNSTVNSTIRTQDLETISITTDISEGKVVARSMGIANVKPLTQSEKDEMASAGNALEQRVAPFMTDIGEPQYAILKERAESGELTRAVRDDNADSILSPLNTKIGSGTSGSKDPLSPLPSLNEKTATADDRVLEQPALDHEDMSIQSISSAGGFEGLNMDETGSFIPPDVTMGVGPNHVMEGLNVRYAIYSENGALLATVDPSAFWGVPTTDNIFDPRVMYDVLSGRWFIAITDATRSSILLATSDDSSPLGTWLLDEILYNGGVPQPGICPDFPMIGVSSDKFALVVNEFGPSGQTCGGNFLGSVAAIIEKADMLPPTPHTLSLYSEFVDFATHPSQSLTPQNDLFMMSAPVDNSGVASAIGFYTVTGNPGAQTTDIVGIPLPVNTYSIPPNAVQPGTTAEQDTGDTRFSSPPQYRNGELWAAHSSGCFPSGDTVTRSCSHLLEISTVGPPTVTQDFFAGISNTYMYYPAITTDGSADMRLVFGASSASLFPSIFATGQDSSMPFTLDPQVTLRTGTEPNLDFDGTRFRAGDYFGAAVDPVDPGSVWLAGEYHSIPNRWSTFISKVTESDWSSFIPLGGPIRSDSNPVVTTQFDGRIAAFVIGTDSRLYYKTQTSAGSSSYTGFILLGGIVRGNSDPAVAMNADGRLSVFIVGTDNGLWEKHQVSPGSTSWTNFVSLGGQVRSNSEPAAIRNGFDNTIAVFVVGTDNALYVKWQTLPNSNSYSPYQSLGGLLRANSHPVVTQNAQQSGFRLEVFIVGTDNRLYNKFQTTSGSGGSWSPYQSLGGVIRTDSNPDAIRNADGRIEVYVVGSDSALYNKWQNALGSSNSYSGYQSLGGLVRASTDPDATINLATGRLEVFIVGTDNNLYHKWQISFSSSNNYSPYESLGGVVRVSTDPDAEANVNGRLEVFIVGTDNNLYHKTRSTA